MFPTSDAGLTAGGTVDVLKFANERKNELFQMQQLIAKRHAKRQRVGENTGGAVESVFKPLWEANPLPRHLRRRTTSHKRRCSNRASGRFRSVPEKKRASADSPAPRRSRRRAHNFNARLESGMPRRLETHIWHAKRFKMKSAWSGKFILPESRNDIGPRAVNDAANHRCAVHDTSYFNIFEIEGGVGMGASDDPGLVRNVFNRLLSPDQRLENNALVPAGFRPIDLYAASEEFPEGFVGPAEACFFSENKLWVLSHPELEDQTRQALGYVFGQGFRIKVRDDLATFRFVGPLSQSLAQKALGTPDTLRQRSISTLAVAGEDGSHVPVTCVRRENFPGRGKGGGGITLMLPKSYARPFWVKFIHAGCVAIGTSDYASFSGEHNAPSFPEDYPDTAAGGEHIERRSKALTDAESRKASRHRLNFMRLRHPSPFVPTWEAYCPGDSSQMAGVPPTVLRRVSWEVQGALQRKDGTGLLVQVFVRACRKGVPRYGAVLALPDLEKGKCAPPRPSDVKGVEEQRGRANDQDPTFASIGFVTSGCRSQAIGKSFGIGICSYQILAEYWKAGGKYIYFRNNNSTWYRPAYFSTQPR